MNHDRDGRAALPHELRQFFVQKFLLSSMRSTVAYAPALEPQATALGVDGTLSSQVDVVVLCPSYPPSVGEEKVHLLEGVAATSVTAATTRSP